MRYAVLSALLVLAFAPPVLADDPPPPTNEGGWEWGGGFNGGFESPPPPPPGLPEPPPPLRESGEVQEWGGPFRFYVPPGRYVVKADPILPQEGRIGGLPTGDVGRELEVEPGRGTPASVFYDPVHGPPEFEGDAPPGTEYLYITNPDTKKALRFVSRDQAIYYLGRDAVRQLEEAGVMGYFPIGEYDATDYCNVSDCRAIEQARLEESLQTWREVVQAVENFVREAIEWVVSVVEAVVDWVVDLFKGEEG